MKLNSNPYVMILASVVALALDSTVANAEYRAKARQVQIDTNEIYTVLAGTGSTLQDIVQEIDGLIDGLGDAIAGVEAGEFPTNGVMQTDLNLNANSIIVTCDLGSTNGAYSGSVAMMITDENSHGIGAPLHMWTNGHLRAASASTNDRMPCVALALSAGAGTNLVLVDGYVCNTNWSFTPGGLIYVSTNEGVVTASVPTASGDFIQVIGYATTADTIHFSPNSILIELL